MSYGVTPTGFVRKSLEQIKADVEARIRASDELGPAVNLTAESALGQLFQIFCEEIASVWEVQEAEHKAWDPDNNGGESQDNVCALTGTVRRDATKSVVGMEIDTTQAVNVPAGDFVVSVDGNPAARFVNTQAIQTGGAALVSMDFEAETAGPTVANAGTVTEIETPVAGITSVTNPLDATVGTNIEGDEDLRVRREEELDAVGAGTVDSIRARLLQTQGVTEAEVYENVTDFTDGDGRPPHSIHAVVIGGDDDDVAQTIWDTKGGGIKAHGSDFGTAVDLKGIDRVMNFDRADEIEIWLEVDLDVILDEYPADGSDQVAAALVALGDTLRMGRDVIAERLQAAVFGVSGVYDLTGFRLGFSPAPAGTANLPIAFDEKAVFDTSRVLVLVTGVTP
jgi:uncharacterized phage protein gp47/JayE